MGRVLVMVADVDLDDPDGRRVHVTEVARGLGELTAVDLVTRGADPALPGVRHVAAAGGGGPRRIAGLTLTAGRTLLRRRGTTRALYLRHDPGTVAVSILARLLGYRIVLEVNAISADLRRDAPDGLGDRVKAGIKQTGDRVAIRAARAVVVVSPALRESVARLRRDGDAAVHVIANGADTRTFHPADREAAALRAGLAADADPVVFTGTLTWWMDLDTLLDAFARVRATWPSAVLVVVGDGPERARLEARAGDGVRFTGAIAGRAEVADHVAAARVCVATADPALRTGRSPLKVLEYLASARPVVASDVEGNRDPVTATDGGVLVPPGDATALADEIVALLRDRERAAAMAERAAAIVAAEHSWTAVVGRLAPLLGLSAPAPPAAAARR